MINSQIPHKSDTSFFKIEAGKPASLNSRHKEMARNTVSSRLEQSTPKIQVDRQLSLVQEHTTDISGLYVKHASVGSRSSLWFSLYSLYLYHTIIDSNNLSAMVMSVISS